MESSSHGFGEEVRSLLKRRVWVRAEEGHDAFRVAEVLAERTDGSLRVRLASSFAGATEMFCRLGVDAWAANKEGKDAASDLTSLAENHPVRGPATTHLPPQVASEPPLLYAQAALLHGLTMRYGRSDFFSDVGPDCLVWLSPGGPVPELWDVKRMQQAAEGDEQPHVYTLAERALRRARQPGCRAQAIALRGQTGTAQLGLSIELARYWLWRTVQPVGMTGGAGADEVLRLLRHGEVALQALGCTRTRRVSTSSRFGRLLQVTLDAAGAAATAALQVFGVERSRVVNAAGGLPSRTAARMNPHDPHPAPLTTAPQPAPQVRTRATFMSTTPRCITPRCEQAAARAPHRATSACFGRMRLGPRGQVLAPSFQPARCPDDAPRPPLTPLLAQVAPRPISLR